MQGYKLTTNPHKDILRVVVQELDNPEKWRLDDHDLLHEELPIRVVCEHHSIYSDLFLLLCLSLPLLVLSAVWDPSGDGGLWLLLGGGIWLLTFLLSLFVLALLSFAWVVSFTWIRIERENVEHGYYIKNHYLWRWGKTARKIRRVVAYHQKAGYFDLARHVHNSFLAESLGWERLLQELGAEPIDENPDPQIGTLLQVNFPEGGYSRFLRVRCPTGRWFCLQVPPEMQTALEANARSYGLDPDTYLKLEGRT